MNSLRIKSWETQKFKDWYWQWPAFMSVHSQFLTYPHGNQLQHLVINTSPQKLSCHFWGELPLLTGSYPQLRSQLHSRDRFGPDEDTPCVSMPNPREVLAEFQCPWNLVDDSILLLNRGMGCFNLHPHHFLVETCENDETNIRFLDWLQMFITFLHCKTNVAMGGHPLSPKLSPIYYHHLGGDKHLLSSTYLLQLFTYIIIIFCQL